MKTEVAPAVIDFAVEVKEPAIRMVKLYVAQAIMTAAYIYSLSCVGMSLILITLNRLSIEYWLICISMDSFIKMVLCILGERLAMRMREDLFASILRQDVAFYDNHKSGEIMSRLTSDIQEFKSSFKQV